MTVRYSQPTLEIGSTASGSGDNLFARPWDRSTAMRADSRNGHKSSMRLGVLDVGSNSAQLQVVDGSAGGPPLPIYALNECTGLGDLGEQGVIADEAVSVVAVAVAHTVDAARLWQVSQLYAFATAAIRDAPNREQVLDRIEAETGVRLQHLTDVTRPPLRALVSLPSQSNDQTLPAVATQADAGD